MKKVLLALAAVAALFAVSCTKKMEPVLPGEGAPVKFTAELKYKFDTKVSATAFGENDQIGIFAGTPIARYNVQGTVGSDLSSVTLASPIKWQVGQTAATTFAAYYPYSAEKTPANAAENPMAINWAVAADQHEAPEVASSDLLIAKAANVAVGNAVSLPFTHALSKVGIYVTKAISAEVERVEILGTKIEGSVNLVEQTLATTGSATPIRARTRLNDSSPFEAIIFPQTVAPQIRVTVTGGTTYTFTMDGQAIAFESGKAYYTTVHLSQNAAQQSEVTFSVDAITDWTNGDYSHFTYQENDPVVARAAVWSVIGTINGSSWNEDFPMEQTATGSNPEDGTWEATITVADGADGDNIGDEFKLRWAGDWGSAANGNVVSVGGDPSWWFYDGTNLQGWQANAANIKCKEAGRYKITLHYPSCVLDVVKQQQ